MPDPTDPLVLQAELLGVGYPTAVRVYYVYIDSLSGPESAPSPLATLTTSGEGYRHVAIKLPVGYAHLGEPGARIYGAVSYDQGASWGPAGDPGRHGFGIANASGWNAGEDWRGDPSDSLVTFVLDRAGGIRLVHETGNVCWDTDSFRTIVRSANVPVLALPLATLVDTPDVLLGKDMASGLPAFCPAPILPARYDGPVPLPTVVADPASEPSLSDQQRCGAANRMASVLTHVYGIAQAVVSYVLNQILSWQDHLDVAASLVCGALRMAEAARWIVAASDVLLPKVTELLGVLVVGVLADQFGGISNAEFGALQEACYCALSAEGGQITITQATVDSWGAGIAARSGYFLGANANICPILLGLRSLDAWQDDATTGATAPSTDCAGYSCG